MAIFKKKELIFPREGAPLPTNRRQLFRDVLKVRFFSLVGLNLMEVLIWIPAALWTGFHIFAMLRAADMHELIGIFMWYLIVMFPLIAITGPFEMGAAFVARNWARDQHAFVISHFKEGMKQNWKQGLIYSTLTGLVTMLCGIACIYYFSQAKSMPIFYVPMFIAFLILLLWNLSALTVPTIIVSYDMKMKSILKDALILTIAELPRAFFFRIITLIIPVTAVVIALNISEAPVPTLSFTAALYACIVPAFNKLIAASFANMACEKYINSNIEGAPVNIGIYPGGRAPETVEDDIEV